MNQSGREIVEGSIRNGSEWPTHAEKGRGKVHAAAHGASR